MIENCKLAWKALPSETLFASLIVAVLVGLGYANGTLAVLVIGVMHTAPKLVELRSD